MLIEQARTTHRTNSVLILNVYITCWKSALWVRDSLFLCILLLAAVALSLNCLIDFSALYYYLFVKYIWNTFYSAHVPPCCPALSRFGTFSTALMLINPPLWCSWKSWVRLLEVRSLSVFKFELNQGSGEKYASSLLHWGSLGAKSEGAISVDPFKSNLNLLQLENAF